MSPALRTSRPVRALKLVSCQDGVVAELHVRSDLTAGSGCSRISPIQWDTIMRVGDRIASLLCCRMLPKGLVAAVFFLTPATLCAQIPAPPRHDTRSEGGVSYRDGSFNWSEQDLSIGGEDGLQFGRTYVSTMGDGFSPGWLFSTISLIRVSKVPQDPAAMPPPPQLQQWVFSVMMGDRSFSFVGGNRDPHTGAPTRGGTYQSVEDDGASLAYVGTSTSGYFVLTEPDGTVVTFNNWVNGRISSILKPDGTRLDYNYQTAVTVRSSRGYEVIVEGNTRACVVNLAVRHLPAGNATCPAGVQTVDYGYSAAPVRPGLQVLTSATKAGATTQYEYIGVDHLGCVKLPGQNSCRVSNQYGSCPEDANQPATRYTRHFRDPVISQQFASGQSFSFSYAGGNYLNMCDFTNEYNETVNINDTSESETVMTRGDGAQINVQTTLGGLPSNVRDPLGRVTTADYSSNGLLPSAVSQLIRRTNVEGGIAEYSYDVRGNIVQERLKAKPGNGLADRVTTAGFAANCTNPKTCNKPDYVTDRNGGRTDYTYSPDHGGVLTEAGPADTAGVRPVKRYGYVQRYAWLANGSGGYAPASSPVWLVSEERTCRTTATSGNGCVGGAGDEIVKSYEYGPNAGPNTLLLRGVAVVADGQTRRTCYGYDEQGNRISETSPRAGLGVCP